MTPAGGIGPGSPLIAGALNSNTEYHDFSDDELGASNLFNFADSPDTLQSLESTAISSKDQATFLNPQQLATGTFPDSPNGSFPDSSSESAESTKRTGSIVSSKTPASTAGMNTGDAGDIKMEWDSSNYGAFDDDDNTFNFGSAPDTSAMNGLYGFGEQDDSFMDQSFDFESASSSSDALSNGAANMASPGIPTINSNSPHKPVKNTAKAKQAQQQQQPQQQRQQQPPPQQAVHRTHSSVSFLQLVFMTEWQTDMATAPIDGFLTKRNQAIRVKRGFAHVEFSSKPQLFTRRCLLELTSIESRHGLHRDEWKCSLAKQAGLDGKYDSRLATDTGFV